MSSRSKGQAFAPDFLVSIGVFGVMASMFLLSWNTIVDTQVSGFEDRNMYEQGERTVNHLVTYPTKDWGDPNAPGLAQEPYVLNRSAIENFESLSYSEQTSLLQAQNFQLVIDSDSTYYEIGESPRGDTALAFRRNVLIQSNGSLESVEVEFVSWR